MTILAAHTEHPDATEAVLELKAQLGSMNPRFLLFFASAQRDVAALGDALKRTFDCPSIGSTTAGEFASGKIFDGAVVLLAFDEDHLKHVAVARVVDAKSEASTREAYAELVARVPVDDADPAKLLGLVLQDGLSGAEEVVMSALSSLSNIPFVGGSAGDGGKFVRTHVFVNGEASSGGAALALLELKHGFDILKTQSFDILPKTLTVTRADEAKRRIFEFNDKPAASEYARVLGVSREELPKHFQRHPLGLIVADNEPFVRSPQQLINEDVVFYCNVKEGMELSVLEARDIVKDTEAALKAALGAFGKVEALVNFHCILRTVELEQKGQAEAYAALFESPTSIGFSTYGESYIGHINNTSVMLLFS